MGVWKLFIFIVVFIAISPGQYLETEAKNSIDFILVVDRSPPAIANWTPSQEMFDTLFNTKMIHTWVQCVIKKLLDDAALKSHVNARVVVLMLDRNNDTITVEGEYYTSRFGILDVPTIPALQFAYVQPYPFDAVDFERIKRNVSNAIAANKKRAHWDGVAEIVIWHVPYDGDDPAQIHHWLQMHRPTADIMVALPKYWYNATSYFLYATVIVAHSFSEKAYSRNVYIVSQFVGGVDELFTDTWAFFKSCYAEMKYEQCHYNENGACIRQKVYIPRGGKRLLKYCRNVTKELRCPQGEWECDRLCADASEEGPCSVTCGEGMKTLQPMNSTDQLIKYCKPMNRTCNLAPCAQTVATTTQLGNEKSHDGASMAAWKVTAIVISTTIVLAGAVVITVWRVGRDKKKLLLSELALGPVGNPPKAVANVTKAK